MRHDSLPTKGARRVQPQTDVAQPQRHDPQHPRWDDFSRADHPTRHYRLHQQGRPTSTNPIASIVAWTCGLIFRGRIDNTPEVIEFAEALEKVCIDVVETGKMTKDLAKLIRPDHPFLTTDEFMNAVDTELRRRMD